MLAAPLPSSGCMGNYVKECLCVDYCCVWFLQHFSSHVQPAVVFKKQTKQEDENLCKEKHQTHPHKIRQRQGTNIDNKHKTATGGHITHLTPAAPFYTCVSPLQTKKSLGAPLGTRLTYYSTCLVADSVFLTPGDGEASNDGCHIYRTEVWKFTESLSLLILFIFTNGSKTLPENSLNIYQKKRWFWEFQKDGHLSFKIVLIIPGSEVKN